VSVVFADVKEGLKLEPLTYDVSSTTVVLGALATRDWRPQHHDYHFATERNGVRDIFLNAPNQAAWFERYITDWTGPRGRMGRMRFRMKGSVFPGDTMVFTGVVTGTETDDTDCGWADVEVAVKVGDEVKTTCTVRVALPTDPNDNPWSRHGDRWKP
jgi:hypothetical protein